MQSCFAYGSNLSREQMAERCPEGRIVGVGFLPDHRLVFSRYPFGWSGGVADVIAAADSEVWGAIWTLSDEDLSALDLYEDVPRGYVRNELDITMREGGSIRAWVYTLARKSSLVPPRREYLAIITAAAGELAFPEHYRERLEATPTIDVV